MKRARQKALFWHRQQPRAHFAVNRDNAKEQTGTVLRCLSSFTVARSGGWR
ncbi:MAG: hypothetical protein R2880_05445 [Deinococcales bacterium]